MSHIIEYKDLEPYSNDGRMELFICCASYEERCITALRSSTQNYRPKAVLIFYGKEFLLKGKCQEYKEKLKAFALGLTNQPALEFVFETSKLGQCISKFREAMRKIICDYPDIKVTLDITTFPRQTMFPVLHEIMKLVSEQNFRILYTEPEKYSTENKDGWLTRGVRSVVPILGYGGVQDPLLKKLLIMLPGHEGERAYITWRRHQPDKTILLRQGTPYHKGLNSISERENELLISMSGDVCLYEPRIPAREIDGTFLELEKIYARYIHEYYFVVATLGTKLQALGFFLFAESRPDLQISYAVPIHYNYDSYSIRYGKQWEIRNLDPYIRIDD